MTLTRYGRCVRATRPLRVTLTLTRYGRCVRATRPLRVTLTLILLAPYWLPLLVGSWLADHWPEVEQ